MAGRNIFSKGRYILHVLFVSVILLICPPPSSAGEETLASKLDSYIKANGGSNISVYIESLSDNYLYKKNADKIVPAASVIKVPLMVEIMERIKEPDKKLTLQSTFRLTEKDKVHGSGELKNHKAGEHIALNKLLELMITVSDNTATNMLISYTGFEPVNSLMKKYGLKNTRLEMKIFDMKAFGQGKNNVTTAADMGLLMKKIYSQQVASPQLCNEMISIMKKTQNRRAIPALLPQGTKVAHKTGALNGIYGNSGIVISEKPFVISVFVQNRSVARSEKIIANIAKIAFENLK